MNPIIVLGLIQGFFSLVGRFMDGKKTKTGVTVAVSGGILPALSVFGINITPDGVTHTLNQVLSLFGFSIVTDAAVAAQSLIGAILTAIGSAVALYGYLRKKELLQRLK